MRLHPMTDAHYLEAPPGSYVNLPMAILAPIMLYLSTRTRRGASALPAG